MKRSDYRQASGVLLVLRSPPPALPAVAGQPAAVPSNPAEGDELLLAVWADGRVTGLHGHVDLGTGLQTALAQIVAEELDLPLARVQMVLGSTDSAPNQGATIASASIQLHAAPLRAAAAQARAWLSAQGAGDDWRAVLDGRHVELQLDLKTPTKPVERYRLVGTDAPRVDIAEKATGGLVFVHDMRVPGMLHGRVVRPPYAGVDAGDFVGNSLLSVDESSVAHVPGLRAVVRIRDFVGVVCEREEQAETAMHALRLQWQDWPGLGSLDDVAAAISANPSKRRVLVDAGDVDGAMAQAAQAMPRRYVWPYQMHASIGPSCALADWRGDALTVWAGTQNPFVLRADLARLTGLADTAIEVVRMEAAGCYGRNGADDVAADAALLSRAVGAPVRVQLTRAQEHAWEPKGAAQLMDVRGGLNADGSPAAYDFSTSYPSNGAPTLALLLTRSIEPTATAYEMGDRTAVPPYAYANLRVAAHDMAPILRASWLRGVSALPNSFAHESYIDELATAAGVDPVAYRLRHLPDTRAAELVQRTAERAGWLAHTQPQQQGAKGDWLQGQGFAYARYVHSRFPGFGAAWSAWVADVEVNKLTGEVHVARVVVGHDAGLMVNPAGVRQQIHGNVLQTTSRALKEKLRTDAKTGAVAGLEWSSYPILNFREVPVVQVLTIPRPGEPPLGAGESSSVPGTAAIANAIFDATGVRLREPPFTPEVLRAALGLPEPAAVAPAAAPIRELPATAVLARRKPWAAVAVALVGGLLTAGAAVLGLRPALPALSAALPMPDAATLQRGERLAALGNCATCHTAPAGLPNAGGRALETPFGTVFSSNLTPDPATGIGRWTLLAFTRAMREGISHDGRHLYPAFPYTSFTRTSDADLADLYAWLMAQPPVRARAPETTLRPPFNLRPLMALWNALYLQPGPVAADPQQTAAWNRGAELVNGLGHCGACHTPRDALGAERSGTATFAGAMVDGWEAPPLTALSHGPRPWTQDALFQYLRHGHHADHGAAAGPMAPVVRKLQALPDTDLQAMAEYLASFSPAGATGARPAPMSPVQAALPTAAQRQFDDACGACHHAGDGPAVFGLNLPLASSSKLHSARPDNLLHVMLDGIREPSSAAGGWMPGFRHALDDAQIADIAAVLRQRYAPGLPAWVDLEAQVARVRAGRVEH
jgi:nicotinate dehydrogenase subunit B